MKEISTVLAIKKNTKPIHPIMKLPVLKGKHSVNDSLGDLIISVFLSDERKRTVTAKVGN